MITRHFANVGERQVHYRRLGAGPPVLILHQSPKNSAEQAPLMQRVAAAGCTAIAPDTPGFGQSDPLPSVAAPAIDAFALAVADFMDAIGVARAPVYGFHTGASIATRLAALRPDRVALLVANGVLALEDDDRADFLAHYLPAYAPRWDGSHLVWAWQRMRDQSIFFPWHRRTGAARMVRPPSEPAVIHENVMDLFAAGAAYVDGYGAALAYDGRPDMARMPGPALYLAIETDPLTAGLPSWPPLPSHARTVRTRTIEESWDAAAAALALAAVGPDAPPPPRVGARARWTSDLAALDSGAVHVRRTGAVAGRPLVLIHDVAGSSLDWTGPACVLLERRPIVALDLPGHGRSDHGLDPRAAIAAAIDAFALGDADVLALGWSGALGDGPRWTGVSPPGAAVCAAGAAAFPDLSTDPDGAHLLRAWRFVRDRRLFDPWFAPSAEGIVPGDADLDPSDLHRATVDALIARDAIGPLLAQCGGRAPEAGMALDAAIRQAAAEA